jgi:hypothetical protein
LTAAVAPDRPFFPLRFAQEISSEIRNQYIRDVQGFLIVYSVTSQSSFHEVSQFWNQILSAKDADKVPIVIVGNKVSFLCCYQPLILLLIFSSPCRAARRCRSLFRGWMRLLTPFSSVRSC